MSVDRATSHATFSHRGVASTTIEIISLKASGQPFRTEGEAKADSLCASKEPLKAQGVRWEARRRQFDQSLVNRAGT